MINMSKIKFGLIGTSNISHWFLDGAKECEDFELVGVYSRSLSKAKEFGEPYGAKLFFDNLEEMAKCEEIDAIYIASPNSIHASQAILCMNNKKHVLVEKAFGSNAKEVLDMIKASRENDVLLMEAMKTVQMPNFKILKDNLYKIGKVRKYFGSYCQYSSRYDKYKAGIIENAFKRELSNGALMDIGVYTIYPMVALFGKPNYIKADAYMLNTGVDGEGSVVFNYDDMMGTIQYSKISNSYIPSEIQGEEGSIIIEQINSFNKITIRYRDGREEVISNEQFEKESMFYEVEEFIKIIKEGKRESEINSHENSLNTMKIMDEVRKQIGLVYLAD